MSRGETRYGRGFRRGAFWTDDDAAKMRARYPQPADVTCHCGHTAEHHDGKGCLDCRCRTDAVLLIEIETTNRIHQTCIVCAAPHTWIDDDGTGGFCEACRTQVAETPGPKKRRA